MSEETKLPQAIEEAPKKKRDNSAFTRVARYTSVRLALLFVTVVVGIFLTIMIANMGGYMDTILRNEIIEGVQMSVLVNPAIKNLPPAERQAWMDQQIALQEKRLGLDKPFMVRGVTFLTHALSLDLGRAKNMSSDSGSRAVRNILLERLPATLVLFATSSILLFFVELLLALSLSRKYGTFWDKFFVALSPTSAAPAWFYGIFLILIFAAMLKILPFGGMVDTPVPSNKFEYFLSLLKHMVLPIMALTISGIFLAVYSWRTFFLIYSSEDYVEMAKAKGLTSKDIERRYVLRPTLPTIITQFSLGMISVWTGAPIMETVFEWPGLGRTLFQAVGQHETGVIVGETVIFAYLLAITVFLLEFVYALVDPRVKIGTGGSQA